MTLVVGLGNPGKIYVKTRHNLGFMVVDNLAQRYSVNFKSGFSGSYGTFTLQSIKVVLLKPMTYMNLSGLSVWGLASYYKIPLDKILLIQDDVDIVFGKIKFAKSGSSGGHNGIKSVISQFSSSNINRMKMGISNNSRDTAEHVLSNFSKEEELRLESFINLGVDGVEEYVLHGILSTMNKFNNKVAV